MRKVDNPTSWPDPQSQANIETLTAWWEQQRDAALAQARYYDELLESARDFQTHKDLHRALQDGPVCHTGLTIPRTAPPGGASQAEPDPDPEQVLGLIAQDPRRLWKADDVRTALGRHAIKPVRTCLKNLTAQGRLEETRSKARHVLYRLPAPSTA